MADETYNGWTNFETWQVNLWLANDEYYDTVARGVSALDPEDNDREQLMADLGQAAAYIGFGIDVRDGDDIPACLGSDIINATLGEVDWAEIVAAFAE